MGERVPILTPTIIELLEATENGPLPHGAIITIDLPNEFLARMELFCKRNPTQLPV